MTETYTLPHPEFADACDCHTHVFGAADAYPLQDDRRYTPGIASVEALDGLHRRLGIGRVVVVQPSPYGADNACTLDAVQALNQGGRDRARAVVVLAPDFSSGILQGLHQAGARGVRINLETHGMHDIGAAREAVLHAAGHIAPLGWHIQLYTNPTLIAGLADTIAGLPVPLVFDHFAGVRPARGLDQPGLAELCELLRIGQVYIKLSAAHRVSDFPDQGALTALVRTWASIRADRLLWGSDWPHPGAWPGVSRSPDRIEPFHPIDDAAALARLADWLPEPELRRAVLVTNPGVLYGWQETGGANR